MAPGYGTNCRTLSEFRAIIKHVFFVLRLNRQSLIFLDQIVGTHSYFGWWKCHDGFDHALSCFPHATTRSMFVIVLSPLVDQVFKLNQWALLFCEFKIVIFAFVEQIIESLLSGDPPMIVLFYGFVEFVKIIPLASSEKWVQVIFTIRPWFKIYFANIKIWYRTLILFSPAEHELG